MLQYHTAQGVPGLLYTIDRLKFLKFERIPISIIRWNINSYLSFSLHGNNLRRCRNAPDPDGTGLIILEHYNDVIMSAMVSQITSRTIVYPSVYLGVDQNKHQSSASLVFVKGIHHWPVNSPHKGPVTRKMLPFDDIIMISQNPVRLPHGQDWAHPQGNV